MICSSTKMRLSCREERESNPSGSEQGRRSTACSANHLPRSGDNGKLVLNDHVTRKGRIVARQVDRDSCRGPVREDRQLWTTEKANGNETETHDRRALRGRSMRWRGRQWRQAIRQQSSGRRASAGLLQNRQRQTRQIRVRRGPRNPALRTQTHLNLDVDVDDLEDELRAGTIDIRPIARANRERLIRSKAEIFRLATGQEPADEGQHSLRGELDVERVWVEGTAVEDVEERLVAGFEGQD